MKKTKYAWYLMLSIIFTTFILLGLVFIIADHNGNIIDAVKDAVTFSDINSSDLLIGGVLLYEGFAVAIIIFFLILSIITSEDTRGSDYWFLIIGLLPLFGPVFALLEIFARINADDEMSLSTIKKLSKHKTAAIKKMPASEMAKHNQVTQELIIKNQEIELLKAQIRENSNEMKNIKINRAALLKEANRKKIYVTINKNVDKAGETTITWNTINKAAGTKSLFNTKKEALLDAKAVKSPKKVLIQDENAKFEYWLTYLDDDNTPIVKANKKDIAEVESNEVMKVMKIKAPTKKSSPIVTRAKLAEKEQATLKIKLREETERVRIIKTTQAQLIKEASQNIIYVTIKKEDGKVVAWNTINKAKETKTTFKTKKEALLKAKAVKSPKKVLIQDESAKYQYWLTYLDNTNTPLVKVNKKSLAQQQAGKDEVMRILQIKDNNKVITKREVLGKVVKETTTTKKVTAAEAKKIREKAAKIKTNKTATKKK